MRHKVRGIQFAFRRVLQQLRCGFYGVGVARWRRLLRLLAWEEET